jgi:hypothetical protein
MTYVSPAIWNASLALVAVYMAKLVLDKGLAIRQALKDIS